MEENKLDIYAKALADDIIKEQDLDKIKNLTNLFNINQHKKNIVRTTKLNELLDAITDQMVERFQKKPNEFSNADLLDYLTAVQNTIDKANKNTAQEDLQPIQQINNTQININNEEQLSKEARDRVLNFIKKTINSKEENTVEIEGKVEDE